MKKILNYIGGEFAPAESGEMLENVNPSTGKVYSTLPRSRSSDVARAIESSERAFKKWSQTSVEVRTDTMRRIAAEISKRQEEFAQAESLDNGKSIHLSRKVDIPRAIKNFEFFADAVTQRVNPSFPNENGFLNYVIRKPIGVIGAISPWNLPLYLLTWKIAPALAAGATVVAKPSEVTPMTAFMLSEVFEKVGLPSGVVNIVHGLGPEVGEPLVTDDRVKGVSFTGSTATGRRISELTAGSFKKLSLEMGGKNPNIIFEDADLELAATETLRAAFSNNGQICLCGSRIYIQESIYDQFKAKLLEKVSTFKVGDPLDESNNQGAMVSEAHFRKVLGSIETAKEEGGKIICGGGAVKLTGAQEGGFYIEPTLIEGLDENCQTNQEEIFGPVATLQPFKTEEEVIGYANSTQYGLAGSVWTKDIERGHRVAAEVDSGLLWVNCWMIRDLRTPFGGFKNSGVGTEGGTWAFDFLTEPKNICIRLGDE